MNSVAIKDRTLESVLPTEDFDSKHKLDAYSSKRSANNKLAIPVMQLELLALVATHCGDRLAQAGSQISIICSNVCRGRHF